MTKAQDNLGGDHKSTLRCYIATTTSDAATQGIYLCQFNTLTGQFSAPALAANLKGASFVEVHPSGRFLHSTEAKGVAAFAIDPTSGKLSPINSQALDGGTCHVSLDATGKVLLSANYGSGAIASSQILEDGSIKGPVSTFTNHGTGPMKSRQDRPHAHSFFVDPSNRFALSCDLGTDQILVFAMDPATAKLTPNDPPFAKTPAGAGPRHLVFRADGKFVYVVNELSSTVTTFAWDSNKGQLLQVQDISMLPADFKGESWAAEIRIHPNSKFVYASNRGHDSIAMFGVDDVSGKLTFIGTQSTRGKWPRNFQIDPTGNWLIVANEHSNNLFVFKIDQSTGQLTPTDSRIEVPAPSCVRFTN